jgi:glycosyltransferase involved in cell wall biosynthesis
MKKVAYFTNIAPHYRDKLWLSFVKNIDIEFHFFFGYSPSIASIDFDVNSEWQKHKNQLHELKNYRFKGRLIYQRKILRHVLFRKWDCIIVIADANLISNWILLFVAKLRKTPIILWGHGFYGKEKGLNKLIKKAFRSFPDLQLVQSNWGREQMVNQGFNPNKIRVIYNSINYDESKSLRAKAIIDNFYNTYFNNYLPTLVFIGRLTKVKRLDILIKALHYLNKNGKRYNLILVGDGTFREDLEKLAETLNETVYFYGACYDEKKISKLIANADLCISPGNVGLTSIHSMSYGTPVCTHNDFKNQMPEFEAIIEGKTGCFFDIEKNNLTETISNWFKNSTNREIIRKNCYQMVDDYYNPYIQTKIMDTAIKNTIENKI